MLRDANEQLHSSTKGPAQEQKKPSEGVSAWVLPRTLTKVDQQVLAQQGLVKGKAVTAM